MIFAPARSNSLACMFVIRRRANMPLADIGALITAVRHHLAQHRPVFVVFRAIGHGSDFMRISSGQHTGAARQAKRLGYIGTFKPDAPGGNGIHRRRFQMRIACTAHGGSRLLVSHYDEDIGTAILSAGYARETQPRAYRHS